MVTVKGKATIPVSGSGDRASLEVAVVGCTSSHICLVTPAEMENEVNAQGDQSDFYAVCGTDKITIYSEDKQLGGATDVYYFVTDGVFDTANLSDGSVDVDKLEAALQPSHVVKFAGTATVDDSTGTLAITVTGALSTDVASVVLRSATADVYVKKAVLTADTLTVTLSGDRKSVV